MAKNENLHNAKKEKNDEFYTRYEDIEREMNAYIEYDHDVFRDKVVLCPCDDPEWSNFTKYFAANFWRLGLKKLISTSYAFSSKKMSGFYQPTLFETDDPQYDAKKSISHGKVFTMTRHKKSVDPERLSWKYLDGDGDFRSEEVKKLRDEADIIITNPPFSLFREFLEWINPIQRQFVMIGNMNAITYKEVFPLLKNNVIWMGNKSLNTDMYFDVPDDYKKFLLANKKEGSAYKIVNGVVMGRLASACWFTNIDHGKRHEPMNLMTMADNLKYNKKLISKLPKDENGKPYYPKYDNYDAIEVPVTDGIPSDYNGVMGVPITFLDKYCPEQFEILNANDYRTNEAVSAKKHGLIKDKDGSITLGTPPTRRQRMRAYSSNELLAPGADGWHINGKRTYARVFIRKL